MKRHVIFISILFLSMLLIPFLAMGSAASGQASSAPDSSAPTAESSRPASRQLEAESFRILDETTGEIVTVSNEEFAVGGVAAEMPPTFEPEALKAQSVAAYTYYSNLRQKERENPTPDLNGADFSADLSNGKIYWSKSKMQEAWGEQFEEYYQKISDAVQPVIGQVLTNGDELIVAAFHAISGGTTETSADVFGGEKDYLVAVPSPGDLLAPEYQTTVELSADEFKAAAQTKWPDLVLDGEPQTWVGNSQRTSSGMVKSITIGNKEISGSDMRSVFSLRSANFDLVYAEDRFVFTVRGYGHGVGMSQYGANYMAQQGSDYQEILAWYYPNTQLTSS